MSAYHLRNLEVRISPSPPGSPSSLHGLLLQTINLTGNKLVRLCPDVGMMHRLRHINLTDNCLTGLPSALSALTKLMVHSLVPLASHHPPPLHPPLAV
jgi:hypothetical protein